MATMANTTTLRQSLWTQKQCPEVLFTVKVSKGQTALDYVDRVATPTNSELHIKAFGALLAMEKTKNSTNQKIK